jgi:Fe-S-cluster containining protein
MNGDHQNICIHCGLCCDGTLFNHARIKENEPLETGYSFQTFIKKQRSFKLPCSYLKDTTCSIYNQRPYAVCESFRCKLLRSVISENVSYTDAIKIINEVTALKTKIELQILEHHPENTGDSISNRMKEFEAHFAETMNDVEFRKEFGHLLLDFFILKKKLSDSFRKTTAK